MDTAAFPRHKFSLNAHLSDLRPFPVAAAHDSPLVATGLPNSLDCSGVPCRIFRKHDVHCCMQQAQEWPATRGRSTAAQHQTTTMLHVARPQRHRAVSTSAQPAAVCTYSPDDFVQLTCASFADSACRQPSSRNRAAAQLSWKAACKWAAAWPVSCPPRPAKHCRDVGLGGQPCDSGFAR